MKPTTALATGLLLLACIAGLSILLGIPAVVAVRSAITAAGVGIVIGALGIGLLKLLTRAAVRKQVSAPVLMVLCVVALGALAGVNVVFTGPQLGALAMLLVAAGVVGVVLALMFAEDIRVASSSLQQAARAIAEPTWPVRSKPTLPEFAELAAELERTSAKLEESRLRERAQDEARRELVSWISHDLRGPLQRMRAAAEALEDRMFDRPDGFTSLSQTVREEADRLAVLVDDLFELSRIESGALELALERVALDDLVSELTAALTPVAQARDVRLEARVSGPVPEVQGSPKHLARAFSNLLDNAVRETRSGGVVAVELAADNTHALLTVADECGGILDEQLQELVRGRRRDGVGRPPVGLGLPIAVGLVAAHGGDVTASNGARGCRFTIRLPLTGPDERLSNFIKAPAARGQTPQPLWRSARDRPVDPPI